MIGQIRQPQKRKPSSKRTIYILRHAKSKQAKKGKSDYERHLTKRGIKDAQLFAGRLRFAKASLDRIIASGAPRGRDTANLVASGVGAPPDRIHLDRRLYGATVHRWLSYLRRLSDADVHQVLVVGHNPEIEMLIRRLTVQESIQVPPCGGVALSFNGSWASLATPSGKKAQVDWSHYPERYSQARPEIIQAVNNIISAAQACLPASFNANMCQKVFSKVLPDAINEIFKFHRRSRDLTSVGPVVKDTGFLIGAKAPIKESAATIKKKTKATRKARASSKAKTAKAKTAKAKTAKATPAKKKSRTKASTRKATPVKKTSKAKVSTRATTARRTTRATPAKKATRTTRATPAKKATRTTRARRAKPAVKAIRATTANRQAQASAAVRSKTTAKPRASTAARPARKK